jgi:serine/threonine protein kinase
MNKSCFTEQVLRNYALGESDDAASVEIERHLAECPACEETLAGFDDSADTLMRHLPLAVGVAPEAASSVDDRPGWLERLRGGPPVATGREPDPAVAVPALPSLNELSAYEMLGVLGHGGMGIVYRARHRQLNRVVALKVLHPRLTATVEARQRFEREIRILGSLQHPGVVMATDAGRLGSAAYLVMEFIDGVDLARLVRHSGPLSPAEACAVGREMADALTAAHRAGAVHRDVKPSNVMIDRSGRVKLLDFGLAQLASLSADDPETSLGQLLGTLEYMAPEQARRSLWTRGHAVLPADGPFAARDRRAAVAARTIAESVGRPAGRPVNAATRRACGIERLNCSLAVARPGQSAGVGVGSLTEIV